MDMRRLASVSLGAAERFPLGVFRETLAAISAASRPGAPFAFTLVSDQHHGQSLPIL